MSLYYSQSSIAVVVSIAPNISPLLSRPSLLPKPHYFRCFHYSQGLITPKAPLLPLFLLFPMFLHCSQCLFIAPNVSSLLPMSLHYSLGLIAPNVSSLLPMSHRCCQGLIVSKALLLPRPHCLQGFITPKASLLPMSYHCSQCPIIAPNVPSLLPMFHHCSHGLIVSKASLLPKLHYSQYLIITPKASLLPISH